jgi:hypothetical protein
MSGNRGKGRPKGAVNKTTASVKEALQAVYASRGGDDALERWAEANETEFYKLWGRMLPQEVSGPDGGPVEFAGIVRRIVKGN